MKSNWKKRMLAVVLCMVIALSNSSFIFASTGTEEPAAVAQEGDQQNVQETQTEAAVQETPAVLSETTPEATPEATPEPTQVPEVTAAPTEAPQATAEPTQAPEVTATPEATPAPTETPAVTAEPTQTPEITPTPTPEVTEAPEATPVPTEAPVTYNEAVELKHEFKDENGNVTATVTAQIPAGAFQADASELTMEVTVPDQATTEHVKKLMEESLPEHYMLGDTVLYDIRFKVNGTETESQQPIVITFENQNGITVKDVKKAVVFQLDPADPAVEGDKDELVTITQRNDMIESLQNSGQSTDNVDDYDLSEITLKEDGTSDKIRMEGRTSTIYGCYVVDEKNPQVQNSDGTLEDQDPIETENSIKVTVDLNGGTLANFVPENAWKKDEADSNVWIYAGESEAETVTFTIGTPARKGYTFKEWKIEGTSETISKLENDQTQYQITWENSEADVRITAQWNEKYEVDITAASWVSKFTNQYSGNTIRYSLITNKDFPEFKEIVEGLNVYATELKVSYDITYQDETTGEEKKVTRSGVSLQVEWKDNVEWPGADMDLRDLKEKLKNEEIDGKISEIRLNDSYIKKLIAEYENSLEEVTTDSEISGEDFALTDWGTYNAEKQYYTGGDSDMTKLNLQLGVSQNQSSQNISGNSEYLIDTVNPSNVTINLFDYWIIDKYLRDQHDDGPAESLYSSGVNQGHALLFRGGTGQWNGWTGSNGGVTQGIVKNTLGTEGFPELNLKEQFNASGKFTENNTYNPEESLAYLFDPDRVKSSSYGEAYTDVTGLFKVNEDGNYYYSSHDNFAEFDSENNQFYVYNTWGIKNGGTSGQGQFFPFNTGDQVFTVSKDGTLQQKNFNSLSEVPNHYLGLTMSVEFQQPLNGMVSVGDNAKPMVFDFSGDDDVWIFIDDVLVADLGGIHDEMKVSIDFSTGDIHIERVKNPNANTTIDTTILKQFEAAGKQSSVAFNGNTFAGNTRHELKMFYLERGNTDSNLTLSFNLMEPTDSQIIKLDQDGEPVSGAKFELYAAAVDSNGQPVQDENGQYATSGDPIFSRTSDSNGYLTIPAEYDYSQHTYYVLRETAPSGYFSPGDILLKYDKYQKHADGTSSGTNLLLVENRWTTGAVGSFNATIYQSGTLHYDGDVSDAIEQEKGQAGLILAVPLLKGTDGNWHPLYGSNLSGFETVEGEDERTAILEAALYQIYGAVNNDYQKWYLEWNESMDRYQGVLSDLPGDASQYYWISGSEYADMTMAYYFLDLQSLTDIFGSVSDNTTEAKFAAIAEKIKNTATETDQAVKNIAQQIETKNSDTTKVFGQLDVSLFNRTFSSRIYVPNTQPELRVLKLDQDGNPVSGVRFYLYDKENCSGTALSEGVTDDEGLLVFSNKESMGTGTAKMNFEGEKTYYLKEISAPEGYAVNEKVVPVYVTEDGRVYADALEENDGITVRKGLGKLVQTMAKYAGNGSINATLRDITGKLFTVVDFTNIDQEIQAGGENGNGEELNFHYGLENALLEYGTHEINGVAPNPYFEVDTEIAGIIVHQNYDAHAGEALYNTIAAKTDLGDTDIRGLFTGSTTVVVRNRKGDAGSFSIKKTVSGSETSAEQEFAFDVTVIRTEESKGSLETGKDYTYTIKEIRNSNEVSLETGTISFTGNETEGWKISGVKPGGEQSESGYIRKLTDSSSNFLIYLRQNQIITVTGIPFGLTIQAEETADSATGYLTSVSVNGGNWSSSRSASGIVARPVGNPFFVFNNHKDKVSDLTLEKVVSNGGETDKEFPFTITLSDASGSAFLTGQYQWEITDSAGQEITEEGHSGTITDGTLTVSLKHGEKLRIQGLPIGSRYLIRESMMGYSPSVTVNGEDISVVDGAVSGIIQEREDSTDTSQSTDVVYTNTRSGSITITKRTGTGDILNGAGFTLYTVDEKGNKTKVGTEKLTELAMRYTIETEDSKFDQDAMRYNDGNNSYIVHKTEDNKYFYYRFLTETEKNQYYAGTLQDSQNVEAIVQFTELNLNQTYAIDETRVPEGYVQNADIAEEMGSITLPLEGVYDILYTVTNHEKMILPTAGLKGITAILGIGILLLGMAIVLWRFRKKSGIR